MSLLEWAATFAGARHLVGPAASDPEAAELLAVHLRVLTLVLVSLMFSALAGRVFYGWPAGAAVASGFAIAALLPLNLADQVRSWHRRGRG